GAAQDWPQPEKRDPRRDDHVAGKRPAGAREGQSEDGPRSDQLLRHRLRRTERDAVLRLALRGARPRVQFHHRRWGARRLRAVVRSWQPITTPSFAQPGPTRSPSPGPADWIAANRRIIGFKGRPSSSSSIIPKATGITSILFSATSRVTSATTSWPSITPRST